MAFSNEQITNLRATLGLAETADEAAIVAAVSAVVEENVEERSTNQPAAAAVPAGHTVVPEVRLTDLETSAQAGVQAMKKLHEMERDAFLDEHKAKYSATSRAKWAERYDANPEATRELLSSAADLVPTGERGHGDAPEGDDAPTTLAQVRENSDYKNWVI